MQYDQNLHRNLKWLLDNKVDQLEDVTFNQEYEILGKEESHLLVEGGDKLQLSE